MGGILDLPTNPNTKKGRKWARTRNWERSYRPNESLRSENNLQSRTPVILPYNSFDIRPERVEETDVKSAYPASQTGTPRAPQTATNYSVSPLNLSPNSSRLEIETTKLHSNASSMYDESGSHKPRHPYIKRYRNEEEKLIDMLKERERTLREAIAQGQQLRAKCTRYKEEMENMKSLVNTKMTDTQWKRKYTELDKKYRDAKETLEMLAARNQNARDFLDQQKEAIDMLNIELQRERIEKQRIMSSSLSSLHSTGVKDKRGKLAIAQLMSDKNLLEDRVSDLTARNHRGREYLAKMEAENKEYGAIIAKLKSQLLREKVEKEDLIGKLSSYAGSAASESGLDIAHMEGPLTTELYATVQKTTNSFTEGPYSSVYPHNPPKTNNSDKLESQDTKSTGFEIDETEHRNIVDEPYRMNRAYEEINFAGGMGNPAKDSVSEEYIIEAIIEPESDDSDKDGGYNHPGTKDDNDKDEMDGGISPAENPSETKLNVEGETITRF